MKSLFIDVLVTGFHVLLLMLMPSLSLCASQQNERQHLDTNNLRSLSDLYQPNGQKQQQYHQGLGGRLLSSSSSSSSSNQKQKQKQSIEEYNQLGFHNVHHQPKTSCGSEKICTECIKSSFCHWCASDNACHARASIHGCVVGVSTCENTTSPNTTSVCQAQTNCKTCSKLDSCRWCGRDDACYAKGDIVHGCETGAHCYKNDKNCQRTKPQILHDTTSPGMLAVLFILIVGIVGCGCASLGFYVFSEAKTLYFEAINMQIAASNITQHQPTGVEEEERGPELVVEEHKHEEEEGANDGEADQLLTTTNYRLMENIESAPVSSTMPSRSNQRHKAPMIVHMYQSFFVLLFIATPGLVWASIRYFPRALVYNVCASSNDWKSIASAMSSIKDPGDAMFELLFSFQNPNHLDVVIDFGRGSLQFKEANVGTFEIKPNTVIPSMSITDVLVYASLPVEKWQNLKLYQAFKKETLVLDISTEAVFRTPNLLNYTYEAPFGPHIIKTDGPKLTGRFLCSCKN